MGYEIHGKLHKVFEAKNVSDTFRKCDFVVEIEGGKYPQLLSFQIVNDKIEQLSKLSVGDDVTVEFNLRGREWTSPSGEVKYFNTLDAWKVVGPAVAPVASKTTATPAKSDDDIPF